MQGPRRTVWIIACSDNLSSDNRGFTVTDCIPSQLAQPVPNNLTPTSCYLFSTHPTQCHWILVDAAQSSLIGSKDFLPAVAKRLWLGPGTGKDLHRIVGQRDLLVSVDCYCQVYVTSEKRRKADNDGGRQWTMAPIAQGSHNRASSRATRRKPCFKTYSFSCLRTE